MPIARGVRVGTCPWSTWSRRGKAGPARRGSFLDEPAPTGAQVVLDCECFGTHMGRPRGRHGEFVRVDEVEWYAGRRQRGVFSASAACFCTFDD
jgi:hypothetical protein